MLKRLKVLSYVGKRWKNTYIDIHPKVQQALRHHRPIVALESTIITHGMPYPDNLKTALEVEDIVRENGSTPATIAILNGRIKVGVDEEDLQKLATSLNVVKCSGRDLAYITSNSLTGGTTVAATIIVAHRIGLKIFATGGIGGVHRDAETTFDISADLVELGRTPVATISSGVKSILDIPKTLEYLETQGVCVATYGDAKCNFPDFYTEDSGYRVPYNLATPKEAAKLILSLFQMNLKSGLLIGVPIPKEFAIDTKMIQIAIEDACRKAKERNIIGKEVTPFILSAISKITKGDSLKANIALIKNNAKVASQIAVEYYKETTPKLSNSIVIYSKNAGEYDCNELSVGAPVVIGASILDLTLTIDDDSKLHFDGATYAAKSEQSAGGVGRNLAEGLYRLIGETYLISAVGNDFFGKCLIDLIPTAQRKGLFVDNSISTSLCSVIFDKFGDCKLMLGNMDIHRSITPELILKNEQLLMHAPLIIFDANLSLDAIECILELAKKYNKPIFFEPTDMRIAAKPFQISNKKLHQQIKMISPNLFELRQIVQRMTGRSYIQPESNDILKEAALLLSEINEHFDCIILTLGKHGVIIDTCNSGEPFFDSKGCYQQMCCTERQKRSTTFYEAEKVKDFVNVSGAGDSFSSGFIAAMLKGETVEKCIALGFHAAKMALRSTSAVPKQYFENESEQIEFLKKINITGKII